MRILVVGGNGTIGQAVVAKLQAENYEVLTAGRSSGDVQVDMTSPESIEEMFKKVGNVDAIISTAGAAKKVLGQINLALIGQKYLRNNGSITLTTGVMKDDPIAAGASSAMANGGVAAFVKAAAIDYTRGIRINCVSPNVLEESFDRLKESFKGFVPVPADRVATAYLKTVAGKQTGQEYKVY